MKRLWLGVALLAVLLAASIAAQAVTGRIHEPIAKDLEQAADAALAEDWEQANLSYRRARDAWQRCHGATASVADHSPMDELDMLFAELQVFAREREAVHFAATCRSAAQMAQAMAQAHSLTWWNFL